ncbi:unnamed protein product, partial [marine sediment metagenome]
MKLEALQGFLRVNPQNTVNDVSLQGKAKRQRRKKKRQSALSSARSAARQKVSGARQAVRQKASSIQVPARVAEIRQKRQMNGGSIKNAIGGMEMSVSDMINGMYSLNEQTHVMPDGTIMAGASHGAQLNAPGGRAARKAARELKRKARQAKKADRKKKTADRRTKRSTRRDEKLDARLARQKSREDRKANRLARR